MSRSSRPTGIKASPSAAPTAYPPLPPIGAKSLSSLDDSTLDKLYAKAMELGATDEGPPGERMPVFYGGYVRDPDGNKLCFFDMKMG